MTSDLPGERASKGARRGELTHTLAPGEQAWKDSNDMDPEVF